MTGTNAVHDPALARALVSLAPPAILVDHRLIATGDENALLAEEAHAIPSSAIAIRRASGAARIVGRGLLDRLGCPRAALPRAASGEVRWPPGVVGSFAHDERVAIAALARARDIAALGIDIEPAAPLAPEVLDLVAIPRERPAAANDPLRGRLLFCIKEAVYKALYPRDREFLEFHDIAVDMAGQTAVTRQGRALRIALGVATHVVALAWIETAGLQKG